jgi:hypothetical protein
MTKIALRRVSLASGGGGHLITDMFSVIAGGDLCKPSLSLRRRCEPNVGVTT